MEPDENTLARMQRAGSMDDINLDKATLVKGLYFQQGTFRFLVVEEGHLRGKLIWGRESQSKNPGGFALWPDYDCQNYCRGEVEIYEGAPAEELAGYVIVTHGPTRFACFGHAAVLVPAGVVLQVVFQSLRSFKKD